MNLGATYSTNPYLVYNTVSPNNSGALGKVAVRQALSYAIERSQFTRPSAAPTRNKRSRTSCRQASTDHRTYPADYNPYPYSQDKAKSMLAAAGFTASHPLQLKYLYRSDSQGSTRSSTTSPAS